MTHQAAALERELAGGGDTRLWQRLGVLRLSQGEPRAAAAAFERATSFHPDLIAGWQGLARARLATADLDGAWSVVATLTERFPESPFTHLFSGHLHKAEGDAAAAEACYRRALALHPTNGETLFALADLGLDDVEIYLAATDVAQDPRAPAASRINAAFAAGRLDDRRGRYGLAMDWFRHANVLARDDMAGRGIRYRPEDFAASVDATLERYGWHSLQHQLPPLPIELTPIFVVGLPRSGTTLIEQILAAHPRVQAGGELTAGPECERWFRRERAAAGREGPVGEADTALLLRARERYVDALFERDLDGELVVDKLPGNFLIAGFLRLLFPDAPMLHSVRDPRATLWSLYSANFGGHEPYYHDLNHLVHYHSQYRRLMAHWAQVLPEPPRDIRYETLVGQPDTAIAALLSTAGLDDHPDCHRFHEQRRPVFTASHAQVRQPLYTSAIDHWRHYEPWLGPVATVTP